MRIMLPRSQLRGHAPGMKWKPYWNTGPMKTETISITMNPRSTDRLVKCYIDETAENKSIYDDWFEQVHEKTASV